MFGITRYTWLGLVSICIDFNIVIMDRLIEEIVERFPNGKERFETDPVFNKVVMMIANDTDVYKIIDSLVKSNNEITEAFRKFLLI